jgi:Lrp/AsnC family leucine-responsive transcriptional regulator
MNIALDLMDHRILDILQSDGRISMLNLAGRVGRSPTPCSRRVKRLEDEGVITGYAACVDTAALGWSVEALVTVRLASQGADDIQAFLCAVRRRPEITECLLVAGNIDYVLKVRVRDVEGLRSFILEGLKTVPCVAETSTMMILDKAVPMMR